MARRRSGSCHTAILAPFVLSCKQFIADVHQGANLMALPAAAAAALRMLGVGAGYIGLEMAGRGLAGIIPGYQPWLGETRQVGAGAMPTLPQVPIRPGLDVRVSMAPPVQFVRIWQAGLATFAIDMEGRRWVFRNKLGIWKRCPYRRNIVISGKDIMRAKRLVRKSRQLQRLRHQLASYSKKR